LVERARSRKRQTKEDSPKSREFHIAGA